MSGNDKDSHEPKLGLSLEKERHSPVERVKPILWAAALLGAGAAAVFFYETQNAQLSKSSDNIIAATIQEPIDEIKAKKIDQVDLSQKMAIEAAFSHYIAKLEPVDIQDSKVRDAYLATDYYKADKKIDVWSSLEEGKRNLVAVRLWDNYDEDGDIVSVQSDGTTVIVAIMHSPTIVYVPHKPGTPLIISGVQDGGGGITAAIETQSGTIPLPIMWVGQVVILPVF